MKKVFSGSDEVIHLWAQQTQAEGRSSNTFFEDTKELYSYGRHYPLGLFIENKKGEKAVVINTQGYSSTTSGHISTARYATNQHKQFFLPDTEAMKGILHADVFVKNGVVDALSTAIIKRVDSYFYTLRSDTKKRKAATLEAWKAGALSQCNGYIELLDWYGFKMTGAAKKALAKLSGLSPVEAKAAAQKAAEAETKKRAKAEKERMAARAVKRAEAVAAFMAGEALGNLRDYLREHEPVLLRIVDGEIETSKGVAFPVEHGIKALRLIDAVKLSGKGWEKNGHTIHLGHYQIDEILPNGDVKAGCHYVPYAEINRIALLLKA